MCPDVRELRAIARSNQSMDAELGYLDPKRVGMTEKSLRQKLMTIFPRVVGARRAMMMMNGNALLKCEHALEIMSFEPRDGFDSALEAFEMISDSWKDPPSINIRKLFHRMGMPLSKDDCALICHAIIGAASMHRYVTLM